jgi:hypothetical protein
MHPRPVLGVVAQGVQRLADDLGWVAVYVAVTVAFVG